ncbi:class I SAM-dependent methyltransferase [Saccharopolyspora sp. HNM0983]|uniref:Class I SAM-dependent methyltransferase n=1 Tax=Saccharopolyspora montiporae TaxID=2781240 RepID=A0A929G104_9PSEU|nr:class I SAM-dependent methyltransferase [Saccharopolyspora sp. HNM0983]MBE9376160.1 class I SAM-dependent methyltransferase [Saccharopolyspora sp. HNM0983]
MVRAPRGDRDDPAYLVGHSDAETQRLIRQAAFRDPLTRRLFTDAGLSEGMSVLDLGSGAGDVALLAAEFVGPTGTVLGVDTDPGVLRTARARAAAAGLDNVTFLDGDLRTIEPDQTFDAVVERLALMYLADPAAALRAVRTHLRPGAIVAVQEPNWLPESFTVHPPTPLWQQVWSWMRAAVQHAGIDPHIGFNLHRIVTEAGLGEPQMRLEAAAVSATNSDVHDYAESTLRSMLPVLVESGIAGEDEIGIDTLAQRLRAEALAAGSVLKVSDMVGAHAVVR